MADYVSILTKAIDGLSENTPERRLQVYAKARSAIDRKLRSMDPPPAETVIASQLDSLEAAIADVEASHAASDMAEDIMADLDLGEMEPVAVAAPAPPRRPAAPPQPPMARPSAHADQADMATGDEIRPSLAAGRAQHSGRPPQSRAEPQMDDWAAEAPAVPRRPSEPHVPESVTELDAEPRDHWREREDFDVMPARRKGGIARIATLAAIVLVLCGVALAGWSFRDQIARLGGEAVHAVSSLIGLDKDDNGAPSQATDAAGNDGQAPAADGTDSQGGKDASRIGGSDAQDGGEPVPAGGQQDGGQQDGGTAINVEPPVPADEPQAQQDAANVEVREVPVQGGQAGGTTDAGAGEPAGQVAGTPDVQPSAAGQKAYLYEEGGGSSGASRSEAVVSWTLTQEPPEEGMPPEATIRGSMDVPGRGLSLAISIKRNVDEALPASHIIELNFTALPEFSGGDVDSVARFVMKSTEQARGESLIAVPARIDAGYFLVALNNLPQALETNERLLLGSQWIDIVISYVTGRRALVTLEKGESGDEVFRQAFEDWKNR